MNDYKFLTADSSILDLIIGGIIAIGSSKLISFLESIDRELKDAEN